MKRMLSSARVAPAPQRMEREPLKPICATDEEAKEWAAKWWQEFSAADDWHCGKAADGDLYQDSEKLLDLMRPASGLVPVKLDRGSWLLERARKLRRASTDEERWRAGMAAHIGKLFETHDALIGLLGVATSATDLWRIGWPRIKSD